MYGLQNFICPVTSLKIPTTTSELNEMISYLWVAWSSIVKLRKDDFPADSSYNIDINFYKVYRLCLVIIHHPDSSLCNASSIHVICTVQPLECGMYTPLLHVYFFSGNHTFDAWCMKFLYEIFWLITLN